MLPHRARISFPQRLVLAAIAIGIVITAARLVAPDGFAHGGTWRMLGRLHPLLVHFPIVLLLLVPPLEWLGHKRLALGEAAGFVLGLAIPCSVAAVLAGLALARADGHDGSLLIAHLKGGTVVAVGTTLAWLVRGGPRAVYGLLLTFTLGTLAWSAHNGGSLTHGEDYLTESLPSGVKQVLHIHESPPPEIYAPDTLFAVAVHPVLEKHCLSCHGSEKQKGDYRMDNFAALLAGGKSGKAAIVPGDLLHSELLLRLALDPADEKVMPPRKKPRPTAGEIAVLRWWIKQGAEKSMPLGATAKAPPEVASIIAAQVAGPASTGEVTYIPKVGDYRGLHTEIERLQQSLGIKLVPVSEHAGDGLILRTRGTETHFGDTEFAQLTRLAPFIVEAELTDTKVTDAGLAALKPFSHLERLHLERTALTGSNLGELAKLPVLNYLNLCSTAVTDDNLVKLSTCTGLKQLYLFDSKVTPAGVDRLRSSLPQCKIGPLKDNLPENESR